MKRSLLAAGAIAFLSIAGCWYEELHQEDVCVSPLADAGPTPACPTREQVLSDPYVAGSATCNDTADPIVSVDEGPILVPDAGIAGRPECCYLATFRTKYCLPE